MEFLFDGKVHALDKGTGYITEKFEEHIDFLEFEKMKMRMMKEYIEYILENDKEKCLDILMSHFMHATMGEFKQKVEKFHRILTIENLSVIYTPAYMTGFLCQYAVLSIKFKRIENDNL